MERYAQRWGWTATGLACVGAALLPGPTWLWIPWIIASMLCTLVGLHYTSREWAKYQTEIEEAQALQEKWRIQRMKAGLRGW